MDFSDIPITKGGEGKLAEPLTFDDIPVAKPYDYTADIPDVEEFIRSPEAQANVRGFQTAAGEMFSGMAKDYQATLSPTIAAKQEAMRRLDRILRGTMAYARGAPEEQARRVISPEYEMSRQMQEAQTPEEYYRAALPLGMEAFQLATLPFGLRAGAGPRVPPVPFPRDPLGVPPVQTGPLMAVPDPFAPAGAPPDLAAAIARSQQTRMDQALAEQAGRQAQPPLLTEQFAQPAQELVGAAPPYDPMAVARWHQGAMAEMQPLLAQEYLMKKMGQPIPKPLADAIKAGNEKLQQGYQPPPERRFVIPAAPEETVYASTKPSTAPVGVRGQRPSMGTGAPLRQPGEAPVQGGAPPAGGVQGPAQPGPPVTPGAGQPPPVPPQFTGAHHAALVEEYGPQVIQRGEVKAPIQYIAEARERAKKGTDKAYQAASKVTSGQAITHEELADLVVEHDRLRQAATDAERDLRNNFNPHNLTEWNEAMQVKQDFAQNILKPAATRGFGEFGRVLQEVEPADPTTMTGARDIANQRLNRELGPAEQKDLAASVERTNKRLKTVDEKIRQAERSVKPGKVPTKAELANRMGKIIKDLTPCIIK